MGPDVVSKKTLIGGCSGRSLERYLGNRADPSWWSVGVAMAPRFLSRVHDREFERQHWDTSIAMLAQSYECDE
jgi:hypothetical protein